VEESVLGWKEYELEVMRDFRDNFVVICTIENFDPWAYTPAIRLPWLPHRRDGQGIFSVCATLRPQLSAKSRGNGGSNVQFAVNPENAGWWLSK